MGLMMAQTSSQSEGLKGRIMITALNLLRGATGAVR